MIRVWDPVVRALHWALALSFAIAWLSSEHHENLHDAAGYVAGALVAARVVGAPGFRLAAVGINGMTKIFAEELRGTDVLVNSVDPGWVRTRSPNATRSIEEGVATTVWLATLPEGGPSGQFFRDKQPLPW